jgi:hypothetical protein
LVATPKIKPERFSPLHQSGDVGIAAQEIVDEFSPR